MEIEVRKVSPFLDDDGTRHFVTLAHAVVGIPEIEMTLREVWLTWSPAEGFSALPPRAPLRLGRPAVSWNRRTHWARCLASKIAEQWRAQGGTLPGEVEKEEVERAIA